MEKSHVRYVGGTFGEAGLREMMCTKSKGIYRRGTGLTFVVRSRVALRILTRFIRTQLLAESGLGTQSSGQAVTETLNMSIIFSINSNQRSAQSQYLISSSVFDSEAGHQNQIPKVTIVIYDAYLIFSSYR